MSDAGRVGATSGSDEGSSAEARRVAELKQRIHALSELGDTELGEFTRLDWIVLLLLGGVVPLAALYWGAP